MAKKNIRKQEYVCPKCGCRSFESDQFQATGGTLSKMFDIQSKKFITISCRNCGYTELYKATTSLGDNILDILISG